MPYVYYKRGTILSTLCILTIQSLQQHSEEDIIHIFQMRKLMHREIKELAEGHQAVSGRAWVIPTQLVWLHVLTFQHCTLLLNKIITMIIIDDTWCDLFS